MEEKLRYSIWDPTGNITALVESRTDPAGQPDIARRIMGRHPEVEQVGFVTLSGGRPSLCMAGGEFCGNATMSAAALWLRRKERTEKEREVYVEASGARDAVRICLREINIAESGHGGPGESSQEIPESQEEAGCFQAEVFMPPARGIRMVPVSLGDSSASVSVIGRDNRSPAISADIHTGELLKGDLPLVEMEGICHLMIEADSPFMALLNQPGFAVEAIRSWCKDLSAEGLGLMFLEQMEASVSYQMTPLVYIPGSDTVFWEHSCASGSAAAGIYLAEKAGRPVRLSLEEPGGVLEVSADPADMSARISGRTRQIAVCSGVIPGEEKCIWT